MDFEKVAWNAFRSTGDIDAYLLHKEIENTERKKWTVSRSRESSQDVPITRNQTAY